MTNGDDTTSCYVATYIYKSLFVLIFNLHYYYFFLISEQESTDVPSTIIAPRHQIYRRHVLGDIRIIGHFLSILWMPVLLCFNYLLLY